MTSPQGTTIEVVPKGVAAMEALGYELNKPAAKAKPATEQQTEPASKAAGNAKRTTTRRES
ncbi:MAG: hypothetical protein L0G99_04420 [Propionibacteriales bacterium]|nr:hypothetical protein [Propionibacteriales bacterium]